MLELMKRLIIKHFQYSIPISSSAEFIAEEDPDGDGKIKHRLRVGENYSWKDPKHRSACLRLIDFNSQAFLIYGIKNSGEGGLLKTILYDNAIKEN